MITGSPILEQPDFLWNLNIPGFSFIQELSQSFTGRVKVTLAFLLAIIPSKNFVTTVQKEILPREKPF